jgi:predicted metalloendopeptidase
LLILIVLFFIQGRKYDSTGNLRDWWAAGDGEEYERRVAVMIKSVNNQTMCLSSHILFLRRQAEQFDVHGTKLNGKLTCGENIADLGGVKLSLRALNKHLAGLKGPAPLINGFTPQQRLFLAWSQVWRENGASSLCVAFSF